MEGLWGEDDGMKRGRVVRTQISRQAGEHGLCNSFLSVRSGADSAAGRSVATGKPITWSASSGGDGD